MITIIKQNGKYYIKSYSLSSEQFQNALLVYRKHGITYDGTAKASYHKNPKVLLDCLYELADNFETKVSEDIKKEIELYDPFVPSFKPKRRKLNKEYFEKYTPIGQFQIDDVYKMFCLGRCLNANKMGLGKTFESIQTINQIFDVQEADRILIIAIPPVLYNWKREILRFSPFFEEKDILIVNKDNRNIFENVANVPKIVIMSYNTFRLCCDYMAKIKNIESKNYRKKVIDFVQWGTSRCIVLDECHKIKESTTRVSQLIMNHRNDFEFRFLLSGTPAPNGPEEYYNSIKFLDDNLIENDRIDFIKSIANVGTRFSEYAIDTYKEEKVKDFMNRIKPFTIRRFLRDHVELPQFIEKEIFIEPDFKYKKEYQNLVNNQLLLIKEEKGYISYKEIKNKFPYILEFLSNPELLVEKGYDNKITLESSPKFNMCKDILSNIFEDDKKSKVIIWEEHPITIESLKEKFSSYGTICIHGNSTPKGYEKNYWRDYLTQEIFRKDSDTKILIANPSTMGVGVNLEFCNHAIVFSEDFSFVFQDQKKARIERFGMKEDSIYWKLIIKESIEEYQNTVMKNKQMMDKLLLKENLSIEDLKLIFKGTAG